MATLTRDVLTAGLLAEEWAGAQECIDDRAVLDAGAWRYAKMRQALDALPEGFRVERVQGRVGPGGDPGAEYTLIDERRRPERMVGRVDRRLIGEQRVTWTGAQLVEHETAFAFSAVLRLAAVDAEGRSRR